MKQKKKKIRMAALITVLSVLVLFFAVFLLFQTRKIEVTGNQYCQDEELVKWVQKDKYAFNSIYIWWKYNYGDVTKPAAIESVKVSIKNPWTVVMKVKEKEFLGYFDYQGEFLYFDEDGTAALKTTEVIPGAPFIEGLELNTKKVKMNKKLPVTDQDIFERIVEVTRLSNKYELSSDRLTCSDGGVNLIFGVVTVQLGRSHRFRRSLRSLMKSLRGRQVYCTWRIMKRPVLPCVLYRRKQRKQKQMRARTPDRRTKISQENLKLHRRIRHLQQEPVKEKQLNKKNIKYTKIY